MRRLIHFTSVIALLGLAVSCAGATRQAAMPVNRDAAALTEFRTRVDAYLTLHKQAVGKTAAPRPTTDTAQIQAARDTLAAAIQSMRKDAKPGDVFTTAAQARIRALIGPEFRGKAGVETKQVMSEDAASGVPIKVNARYPSTATVTTMPPNVLQLLPALPEGLEYRVVGRTLILRDVDADLVVDYMRNAIPVTIRNTEH